MNFLGGGNKSPELREGDPQGDEDVSVEEIKGKVVSMKPGDYLVHIHV
jgi:hypothetical protein